MSLSYVLSTWTTYLIINRGLGVSTGTASVHTLTLGKLDKLLGLSVRIFYF